ncbi:MAG: hypothetical protein OHK0038_02160 [Flammeovirgaceae bacterium]
MNLRIAKKIVKGADGLFHNAFQKMKAEARLRRYAKNKPATTEANAGKRKGK